MSEQEKEIMRKLSSTIPKLDDNKKNYVLGIAEGMAIARETERSKSDRKEKRELERSRESRDKNTD